MPFMRTPTCAIARRDERSRTPPRRSPAPRRGVPAARRPIDVIDALRRAQLGRACARVADPLRAARRDDVLGQDPQHRRAAAVRPASARSRRFTMRSSSEWKAMTHRRPPGRRQSAATARNRSSSPSSSLTAMRSAWNVRVAGFLPTRGAAWRAPRWPRAPPWCRGLRRARASTIALRDAGGEPLLAVLADDLLELALVDPPQEIAGGLARARVHPHVERPVVPEREPALGAVELRRRDAEIDQEAVDRDHPQAGRAPRARARTARGPASPDRRTVRARRVDISSAAGSRSIPISRPSGADRSRTDRACPPIPTVASQSDPRRLRIEPGQDLVEQDGKVRCAFLPRYVIAF